MNVYLLLKTNLGGSTDDDNSSRSIRSEDEDDQDRSASNKIQGVYLNETAAYKDAFHEQRWSLQNEFSDLKQSERRLDKLDRSYEEDERSSEASNSDSSEDPNSDRQEDADRSDSTRTKSKRKRKRRHSRQGRFSSGDRKAIKKTKRHGSARQRGNALWKGVYDRPKELKRALDRCTLFTVKKFTLQ